MADGGDDLKRRLALVVVGGLVASSLMSLAAVIALAILGHEIPPSLTAIAGGSVTGLASLAIHLFANGSNGSARGNGGGNSGSS